MAMTTEEKKQRRRDRYLRDREKVLQQQRDLYQRKKEEYRTKARERYQALSDEQKKEYSQKMHQGQLKRDGYTDEMINEFKALKQVLREQTADLRVVCPCGAKVLESSLNKHRATAKHKKWAEKNDSAKI